MGLEEIGKAQLFGLFEKSSREIALLILLCWAKCRWVDFLCTTTPFHDTV